MSTYLPIETQRLIMREFIKDDFESAYEYLSDEKVCEYMVFSPLNYTN